MQYRKPRPDVYTVLLILALIAILVTILCLWAEMGMYDNQLKGRTSAMASPTAAAPAADWGSPPYACHAPEDGRWPGYSHG